jgi:hypothetical protein
MQKLKKWNQDGNTFSLSDNTKQIETLPVGIYDLKKSLFGFYLEKIEDKLNLMVRMVRPR